MSKKQIALQILDWAYKVNEENFNSSPIVQFLRKYLGQKYDFTYSNRPKFLLYGPFGDSHLDYDESCVRVFCTGENIRTDWNLADYGIDYDLFDFGGGGDTCIIRCIFIIKAILKTRLKSICFAIRGRNFALLWLAMALQIGFVAYFLMS